MTWTLIVANPAQRQLDRMPVADRARVIRAFGAMQQDPLEGDLARLRHQPAAFCRRLGPWRIFFDLDMDARRIAVVAVMRRTSTTYRRR